MEGLLSKRPTPFSLSSSSTMKMYNKTRWGRPSLTDPQPTSSTTLSKKQVTGTLIGLVLVLFSCVPFVSNVVDRFGLLSRIYRKQELTARIISYMRNRSFCSIRRIRDVLEIAIFLYTSFEVDSFSCFI